MVFTTDEVQVCICRFQFRTSALYSIFGSNLWRDTADVVNQLTVAKNSMQRPLLAIRSRGKFQMELDSQKRQSNQAN